MLPMHVLSSLYRPGRYGQWIAAITAAVCAVTCGLDFAWPSSALPQIRSGATLPLTMDRTEESHVLVAIYVGNILSPFFSGKLMKIIGPRNSLCIGIWLQVGSWLLMWLATSAIPLMVSRFMAGIWIGQVYTVVPVYIAESVEPKIRGKAVGIFGVCLFIGSFLQSVIGIYLNYHTIALVCCGKSLLLAVALCLIPESPYYHVAIGRLDLARASLHWLRGWSDSVVLEAIQESVIKLRRQNPSWRLLFTNSVNRKALFIVEAHCIVQRMSGLSVLFAFITVTLPDSWLTAGQGALLLNVVWMVCTSLSVPLLDRFGRKPMMAISCFGSGTSLGLFALWYFLKDKGFEVSSTNYIPLILILCMGVFFSMGIVSVPMVLQGEMFSPEIKANASALTSVTVAFISGLVTFIFLPIEASIGTYFNFAIAAVFSYLGVLLTIFFMIETKGKSLEEIQIMLVDKNDKAKSKNSGLSKF